MKYLFHRVYILSLSFLVLVALFWVVISIVNSLYLISVLTRITFLVTLFLPPPSFHVFILLFFVLFYIGHPLNPTPASLFSYVFFLILILL